MNQALERNLNPSQVLLTLLLAKQLSLLTPQLCDLEYFE